MREVVDLWRGKVEAAIGPLLTWTVERDVEHDPDAAHASPVVRTDAKETPLQKAIRVGSRPVNDAIGTTTPQRDLTSVERVNLAGLENTNYLRDGMRDLSSHRGAYAGATPEEVQAIARGELPTKNSSQPFKPVRVNVEPDGTVHLADGRHRMTAAREAGATEVLADVNTYGPRGGLLSSERTLVSIKPRSPLDMPAARAEVRDALGRLKKDAKGFGKRQGRLINTVAERVDKSNAAEFKRVIGVDVRTLGSSIVPKLDDFRAENVDLISSIPQQMLDEVGDTVEAAWGRGTRVEDLAAQIQKRFSVSESRADLIARDQTLKLNSQLASTRAQGAGITRARWCISNDERVRGNPSGLYPNPSKTGKPRPDHYHLDGQEYEVGVGLVVSPDGRVCEPGEDYQCRCTAEFILSFLDED